MRSFTYEALPGRVVFSPGAGRDKLAAEIDNFEAERVLLIATEHERELARGLSLPLGDRVADIFIEKIGAKTALKDIGMKEEHTDEVVPQILEAFPEGNPRPVDEEGVHSILEGAFAGRCPGLSPERSV